MSYIDGKAQSVDPKGSIEIINPATGLHTTTLSCSSTAEVDAALAAAAKAFPAWSRTPLGDRTRILGRTAEIVRERTQELAALDTQECGRPISETSAVDIPSGADVLDFYANLLENDGLAAERTRLNEHQSFISSPEPLGVCAAIGAWNYPLQIAIWKAAPCLAAGNCLVYKPSEFTPSHGRKLAEILTEAGLPPGAFNVVIGAGDVGAYLSSHPTIAKVSFTGQVATGRKVATAAGSGLKYATMELGGKSACIVLDDCPIDLAVDGAMMANFYSTGQVCTNGTRVFLPRPIQGRFQEQLQQRFQHIRSGDPMDPSTNFGPLSSDVHRQKVEGLIRYGIETDKATLFAGGLGQPPNIPKRLQGGAWIRPTVFTDCTDDMRIVREEIFGPVMCILPYDTIDEAVQRANQTDLGLAAGVFGHDLDRAQQVVARLEAGITWINTWGDSPAEMSVGGWKQSGLGVECGKKGLLAWTRNRSTFTNTSGSVASVFCATPTSDTDLID